jgi:hypothetical protein
MKFEMKLVYKSLGLLCVLCASVVNGFAVDREAFSFTNYDLKVQIDPEQHRLGARGKITLRNDTQTPQKIAVLQISSSLDWRSVKAGEKPVQFVTQPYASDIDHTGALSEAIVTLPQPLEPQATIELEIAYEGVILLDATRLTRIDTPVEAANSTDWDQIAPAFTAVRGAGYVAWYPIATEVANLSEGNSLFEVLGRWKARESASKMHLHISVSRDDGEAQLLVVNQASCQMLYEAMGRSSVSNADCTYQPLGLTVPTFAIGTYGTVDRPSVRIYNLTSHAASAEAYADATEKVVPLVTDWFGAPREKAQTVDLPELNAAAFETGALLLTPLSVDKSKVAGLAAAHQLTHASFSSFRPWIEEGLAHFAQALYLEREKGRPAAIEYMGLHRFAIGEVEAISTVPRSEDEANRSLVNTTSEELYRSKAMYVWWMLRDMVGEAALKKAITAYRPEQDKEPSYMQRLIAAETKRDFEWFFDDWVYRDRGLPDFKIESAFPRKTMTDSFMLTITVDNLGSAGAEVPVIVKFKGGEVMRRLEVQAKNKAVIRVEVPGEPQEIVVNDGSVPEKNVKNNTFKIEATEK